MRSNKDNLFRAVAAVLWIVVLACAAYYAVNFTRKDLRDFTPLEQIAALTPKHALCGIALDGGSETWIVRDELMIDGFVVFFPPRVQLGPPSRLTPRLTRVGAASVWTEIVRGSELEKTIFACLDRAIDSGKVDALSLPRMLTLRARLTKDEFSQDPSAAAR
jgi:hypothetical protein